MEEDEEENIEEIIKIDPPIEQPHRTKTFHNDFDGNSEFEEFGIPRVDSEYSEANLEDCYNAHDYERNLRFVQLVDEFFSKTEYYDEFKNKKIPKPYISKIYLAIKEQFIGEDYTQAEIFAGVAEHLKINYEVMYENIPSMNREILVKELDDKYHILKRKGQNKLF